MLFKIGKNQKGFALIHVVLTLVIALIVLPALLVFIGGAGRTAQIREDRMLQVYAADAGIEKAFHNIISNVTAVNGDWDGEHLGSDEIRGLNDNNVYVDVYETTENNIYRVVSRANNTDGVATTIEALILEMDYLSLMDYALSSPTKIDLTGQAEVNGDVWLGSEDGEKGPKTKWEAIRDGGWNVDYGLDMWPDADYLRQWYLDSLAVECGEPIEDTCTYNETEIDISGNNFRGPGYWTDGLNVYSSADDGNLTLEGTMYINGDLNLGRGGSSDFTVDLEGHTIFCEKDIYFDESSAIKGPGCLIAIGNIHGNPRMGLGFPDDGEEQGDFVFVLSVGGKVTLNPQGTSYGSIHGGDWVSVKGLVEWVEWPDEDLDGIPDLNFPPGDIKATAILSYEILD